MPKDVISERSNQKEWIDLGPPFYSLDEYEDCLYQLDRIGRYLGGDQATFWAFNQLKSPPESIIDVGCGGGLFTLRLAEKYPQAKVRGIDISTDAIHFANRHLVASSLSNVHFIVPSSTRLQYLPQSIDVITSTLVCHHLNDEELIQFLKDAYKIAKKAVIFNDLHRHRLATASYALITPVLRNRLVIHDGFISIKRAFKRSEWVSLLQAAEIPLEQCIIKWCWAFRWIVLIQKG